MARHVAGHWMKADAGVLDLVGMLWADFANEPVGKDFSPVGDEEKAQASRPRRRRMEPSALCYVASAGEVVGHLTMILAITWMSCKFREPHAKIEDPLRQLRYIMTMLLIPVVLYTTAKNWYRGLHFPLTASASFQVLRNRRVESFIPVDLTGADLYCMLANGFFFCGLFLWNYVLLLQRRRDRDVFDPSAHMLVALCLFGSVLRAKSLLLCFLFFGLLCLLLGGLLCSGPLACIALLIWIGVGFRGPSSKIDFSLDMGRFLWGATDVNTGPTSVTKARHCRIDVVQYLSSHMEVLDVMPVPKLDPGEAIP
ncbi:unnamed protein product, partial [Symbiodinium pilosum]